MPLALGWRSREDGYPDRLVSVARRPLVATSSNCSTTKSKALRIDAEMMRREAPQRVCLRDPLVSVV